MVSSTITGTTSRSCPLYWHALGVQFASADPPSHTFALTSHSHHPLSLSHSSKPTQQVQKSTQDTGSASVAPLPKSVAPAIAHAHPIHPHTHHQQHPACPCTVPIHQQRPIDSRPLLLSCNMYHTQSLYHLEYHQITLVTVSIRTRACYSSKLETDNRKHRTS